MKSMKKSVEYLSSFLKSNLFQITQKKDNLDETNLGQIYQWNPNTEGNLFILIMI